jgi:uroporphyrinogen decarboxylase
MERVVAALSHKEADRVPVYPILSGVGRNLTGADYKTWSTDADVCAEAFIQTAEQFDIDCIVTLIDLSVECDAWKPKLIFPENEAAHPDYTDCVIKDLSDYANIKKVDYRTSERMMMHLEVCKKLVAAKGKELPIVAFVFGPLGVLSMLRGQQDMYLDIYDDFDAVKAAAKEINETLKEYVSALCDTGVAAVMFDTLFASGSIMSKEMWMEAEGVLMPELAEIVRRKGLLNMIHNCGRKIYFDVQIETIQPAAISFLYPPDDCKDFAECKEKYGKDITLIGCVTPANAVIGTDEEWDKQCKDQIDAMAKGGGFMLATGCEYPANASFDRARRMIEIAQTYGKYQKT